MQISTPSHHFPHHSGERTIPSRRHSQSCRECKIRVHQFLERIYGTCVRDHRFGWRTGLASYADTPIGPTLRDVAQVLEGHRGFGIDTFVRSQVVAGCDYWVADPGFIVEFDESQHFTNPRKLALSMYADRHPLGFSAERWMELCERHDAKDNNPVYRDEQRAWYDTLRDLVPLAEGLQPTVRLYVSDHAWCALDPDSTEDLKSFSDLIEAGRSATSQPAAGFRFPTLPPAQPADLVESLRWYAAARLVVEGGFDPDLIRPRPPITVERDREGLFLSHDPDAARPDRQAVLGGLKEAKPDVTVTIPDIGPVLALSLEGTESVESGAGGVPELTGKLERTAGACVNLHMMYPALVYGFWHVLSADRVQDFAPVTVPAPVGGPHDHGDHAQRTNGEAAAALRRYQDALARLSERDDIRDAPSRYEACGLTLVERGGGSRQGMVYPHYPGPDSLLDYNRMFQQLYAVYDRRFVDSARALKETTRRRFWHHESPVLAEMAGRNDLLAEMAPRVRRDPVCPPHRPRTGGQRGGMLGRSC